MNYIIINADDLGYNSEVNKQIEECIKSGVVTSSTLMANAPEFEQGVAIAKKYPNISIGIHLNIIEFSPLTNFSVFNEYGIVNEQNQFIEGAIFECRLDNKLKEAIYEEWCAQIEKVKAAGINPTHIDSHEHTHTISGLKSILKKVLDRYEIKHVRRSVVPSVRLNLKERKMGPSVILDKSKAVVPKRRNFIFRKINFFLVKYKKIMWNREMKKLYSMTDSFCAFRYFYAYRNVLNIRKDTIIELMCHPGQKPFIDEIEMLKNINKWKDSSLQFINYYEVQ